MKTGLITGFFENRIRTGPDNFSIILPDILLTGLKLDICCFTKQNTKSSLYNHVSVRIYSTRSSLYQRKLYVRTYAFAYLFVYIDGSTYRYT
jgi:hypothetical protein